MCSNYKPVTRADRLLAFFGAASSERDDKSVEVFPLGLAPFIRLGEGGRYDRVCDNGVFGLLPQFAVVMSYGRKTYNARSETVHKLNSFRRAWAKGQRCIIPSETIFEPCWETGESVRWAIERPGQVPMGVAGIWEKWTNPEGREFFTFAMITVNADGHPVMQRFHRPEDEKRMVVVLPEEDYGRWLSCPVSEAPQLFKPYMGALDIYAAPLKRTPRGSSVRTTRPPKPPPQAGPEPEADLFS
ncbi:SOS response-associated peptidase [Methylibium sp.]|uniref:SOS response-associated peptidase n=1 Tax=Methylibium sp. TaxID=2067992 RepID=UPI003D11B694